MLVAVAKFPFQENVKVTFDLRLISILSCCVKLSWLVEGHTPLQF